MIFDSFVTSPDFRKPYGLFRSIRLLRSNYALRSMQ